MSKSTEETLTYKERRVMIAWMFWSHMAIAFVMGMLVLWIFQELFL